MEVAGLVVGGVGLAALFDSALSGFEHIESGANHGREYNKAALKLSLNQLRLARWKDASSGAISALPQETSRVKELLGEIETNFEDAQIVAKRYKQKPVLDLDKAENATIEALIARVRGLAIVRQKSSSFGQKTRWALHDEKKFNRLAEDQTDLITKLVDLFPATSEQQMQLVKRDAQQLIQQPEIATGPGAAILREAADKAYPELSLSLKAAAQGSTYTFQSVKTMDQARVHNGNYISNDYKGGWMNVTYNFGDVQASNYARQHNGDSYGGKSVYDD